MTPLFAGINGPDYKARIELSGNPGKLDTSTQRVSATDKLIGLLGFKLGSNGLDEFHCCIPTHIVCSIRIVGRVIVRNST